MRAFQRHQQPGDSLRPGAIELRLLKARRCFMQHRHDQITRGGRLLGIGGGVDAHQAGIDIRLQRSRNGVGQPAFFADLLEQAGRHATTRRQREQQRGILRRIMMAGGGPACRQLRLLDAAGIVVAARMEAHFVADR